MKPKNFPARKTARQIAAKERGIEARSAIKYGLTAAELIYEPQQCAELDAARAVRTKKARGVSR